MTDERTGRQRRRLTATVTDLEVERQKAMLISVVTDNDDPGLAEASLTELALLTDTAGSEAVHSVLVKRARPDAALFIGSGKARELAGESIALDLDLVVFDNELSPAQQRNLQAIFEVDVVDRVALILDIFAQHATSKEGMLQVELAQHRYRLPRLRGKGTELSRLGAGINTRGPGETKLETDRRRILERVSKIERQLKELNRSRQTRTKARTRSDLPLASLVGYTNAGKSTLFNRLTDAGVLVEDRLFATLDSTVRRTELPGGKPFLLSDTVGFVRRLPHQLVEAFRSTLEEVKQAELLIHVVDGSDPAADSEIEAVHTVLMEIGAAGMEELLVFNKTDVAETTAIDRLLTLHPGSIAVSAETGDGVGELLAAVADRLEVAKVELSFTVPYDRGDVVSAIHEVGDVVEETHTAAGTELLVKLEKTDADKFAAFSTIAS